MIFKSVEGEEKSLTTGWFARDLDGVCVCSVTRQCSLVDVCTFKECARSNKLVATPRRGPV